LLLQGRDFYKPQMREWFSNKAGNFIYAVAFDIKFNFILKPQTQSEDTRLFSSMFIFLSNSIL